MSQLQTKFIKDSAVTSPKIANNAVDQNKINSTALGSGLSGGSGTTIAVDSTVVRTNGANAFTADQSLGSHKLTNVADPTLAQDAATKNYVDQAMQGISWKQVVRSATTAALPANTYANGTAGVGATLTANANGALPAQDGVTLVVNDRLLVKDEVTSANNGIYIVTQVGSVSLPYILTRAIDIDDASEFVGATVEIGSEATTQAKQLYYQSTAAPITVGTTAISFTQVSSGTPVNFGNGLQNISNTVSVKSADASISVSASGVAVAEDPAGAITTGASGIKVNLEATNPTLQISSNQLGAKLDAARAITTGASGIGVNVDGTSIDIAANAVEIKAAGVTLAKMASNSVDENKIVSTAISSTGGLTGGSGTKLAANIDSVTTKINGSNQIEGLKETEQQITLAAGDITNQYVDLAHAAYGTSASANSIQLTVVGGLLQQKTVDYTVLLTGGAGGVSRVSFAGDLATGGNAALVAGDILVISYTYLT